MNPACPSAHLKRGQLSGFEVGPSIFLKLRKAREGLRFEIEGETLRVSQLRLLFEFKA